MVIQRQQTPRYPSTISYFSPVPSGSTLDVEGPRPKYRREISTFSGRSFPRQPRYPSGLSSTFWNPNGSCVEFPSEFPSGSVWMQPESPPVMVDMQCDEAIEVDKVKSKKKKRLIVRVVRKAGSLASKKLGIKKAVPKSAEVPPPPTLVTPHMAAVIEAWKSASMSKTSLVAVEGSPKALDSPPTQSTAASVSKTVAEAHSSGAATQKELPPTPTQRNYSRMCKQVVLFLPHTALIGFVAFLAPQRLSDVAFSGFLGYIERPVNPTGIFVHHAHTLPYQCGLAVGIFCVALWALFKMHPGFAIAVSVLAYAWTHIAWNDYDTSGDASRAFLGTDDRDIIYWILRGYVLGELTCSFDDFSRWLKEDLEIEEHEEEEETESFEWSREGTTAKDGPLNLVIRLKDRPQETMRIVVEAPETDC